MVSSLWMTLLSFTAAAAAASIDPTLKPSWPTVANISRVDYSLSTYDRIVLLVDETPFFYNGVQFRIDKDADHWNMTDADLAPLFQLAADDGFTVVNCQLRWKDVQPDSFYNVSEAAYIRGGTYESTNFADEESLKIGFQSGNETNQLLTYLKFNFSDYSQDQIDAAKVRVYVNSAPDNGATFSANLFGISDNSWSAANLTWSNAPNHDGVDISGTSGEDYWHVSSSLSWDPITSAAFYDFDASDFIINNCPDRIASFVFQSQVNDTTLTNGATLDGANGVLPPQVCLSSTDSWDFNYTDKVIGWAAAAGIKLEFIWFGSDSTSQTQDSRVPYFVFNHTLVEKVQSDDTIIPVMLKTSGWGYGTYGYLTDKNDLNLRALEKKAIKTLMNHVADYNDATGDEKTVIGFDVANENSVTHIHGVSSTVWQNPDTWATYSEFSSKQAFIDRTEWEYTINLANGVKESNYPVWTRANTFTTAEAKNLAMNEAMRASGGTSLDFVGLDPYSTSPATLYSYGHQETVVGSSDLDWSQGSNLAMVMENSGAVSNAEALVVATLAGGAFYNVYELMGPDNYGLYYPKSTTKHDYTPVARGSYVANVVSTNNLLKKLGYDLSTKRPSGANGTSLIFFNPLSNSTLSSANVTTFPVTFTPSSTSGVGIGIIRNDQNLLLASTRNATYSIDGIGSYGIQSISYGNYSSTGNFTAAGSYTYVKNNNSITFDIQQGVLINVETSNAFPLS